MQRLDGPITAGLTDMGSPSIRSVRLWFDGRNLIVSGDQSDTDGANPDTAEHWPLSGMRLHGKAMGGNGLRLRYQATGAILDIPHGPFLMTIRSAEHHLRTPRGEARSSRILWAYMGGALAIFLVVALLSLEVLPRLLAPLLPDSYADRLGREIADDLFPPSLECDGSAGLAALVRLQRRLEIGLPDGLHPPQVHVVNVREANAVALPGGRIYLFRGLLDKADDVDGVAGVLAHEYGHEIERHGLASVVRQTGLSVALGIFGSGDASGVGTLLGLGQGLALFQYGRDAEREADDWAIKLLRAARINPEPFAGLLEDIAGDESDAMVLFQTHPATEARAAVVRAHAASGRPALSDANWEALRAICDDKPRPRSFIRMLRGGF